MKQGACFNKIQPWHSSTENTSSARRVCISSVTCRTVLILPSARVCCASLHTMRPHVVLHRYHAHISMFHLTSSLKLELKGHTTTTHFSLLFKSFVFTFFCFSLPCFCFFFCFLIYFHNQACPMSRPSQRLESSPTQALFPPSR